MKRTDLAPGLLLAASGAGVGMAAHALVPTVSPHVVAVIIGMAVANAWPTHGAVSAGLGVAGRSLLRWGVALVGFRLSVGALVDLGPRLIVSVVGVVVVTFLGIRWLGRRFGVDDELSTLVAVGFSICGASAIAAARPLTRASEEQVGYAVGLVALCGSLAIAFLPLLGALFGMGDAHFAAWVGASVHDVGQVVAAASTRGSEVVATAAVVKLARVAMLAPVLTLLAATGSARRADDGVKAPLLPWFVVLFLIAATIRSTGLLPDAALDAISNAETAFLAAGMVGLGAQVRLANLRRLGGKPLVLGLVGWTLIASVAYVATA